MTGHPKVLATTPLLVVADLQRSIDFYCTKLGFQEPATWGDPPCFAMMHRDGFDLMLSLPQAPGRIHPNGPQGVWDLYIRVTNVGQQMLALKAEGIALDRGPTKTEYEMLEIEILDPDGYRICFGQNIE